MVYANAPYTPQVFSFGKVFRDGSALFFSRSAFFIAISLLFHLPLIALDLYYPSTSIGARGLPEIVPTNFAISIVANLFTQGVLTAIIIYVVVMELRGRSVSFGDAFSHGLTRTFAAVLTSLVSAVLLGFASLLLLVPGLILAVWFYVAVPASVVERKWPFESLGRSRFLTKGHRWAIFGLLVVYVLASVILNQIVALVVTASGLPATQIVQLSAVTALAAGALITAYYTVLQSYSYYLLVNEKDGVDIETIARVFD
jgi:hypothetical protein